MRFSGLTSSIVSPRTYSLRISVLPAMLRLRTLTCAFVCVCVCVCVCMSCDAWACLCASTCCTYIPQDLRTKYTNCTREWKGGTRDNPTHACRYTYGNPWPKERGAVIDGGKKTSIMITHHLHVFTEQTQPGAY